MIAEPAVGRIGPELVGVGPDARQRRLEVVADAAQEVVLRRVELEELACSAPRPGRTAGRSGSRPRSRSRTARAGPGRRAPTSGSPAGARRARPIASPPIWRTARTGRGSPGIRSSVGMSLGSTSRTSQSIMPNAARASVAARPATNSDAVAGRGLLDRREDPAELAVAALEVGGEAVVAVGEAGQLVVAGDARSASRGRRPRRGRPPPRSPAAAPVRSAARR